MMKANYFKPEMYYQIKEAEMLDLESLTRHHVHNKKISGILFLYKGNELSLITASKDLKQKLEKMLESGDYDSYSFLEIEEERDLYLKEIVLMCKYFPSEVKYRYEG